MRKLISVLFTLIILAVIAGLLLPMAIGFWIQNEYPTMLKKLSHPPGLSLDLIKYHRGWFSSTAQIKVTVQGGWLKLYVSSLSPESLTIDINQTIKNGPFIFSLNPNNRPKFNFAKALIVSSSKKPFAFVSRAEWTWSNILRTHFSASEIKFQNNQQMLTAETVNSFINYNIETARTLEGTNVHIGMIRHKIKKNDETTWKTFLEFRDLQTNSDYHTDELLWYGNRSARLANAVIYLNDGKVTLTGINAGINQSRVGEFSQIDFYYNVTNVDAPKDLKFGPVNISLTIKNIDNTALINLVEKMRDLKSQFDTNVGLNEHSNIISKPLLALIKKGLSANLNNFTINTHEGPVQITGTATLPAETNGSQDLATFLEKNLQAKSTVTLPKTWMIEHLKHFYSQVQQKLISEGTLNAAPKLTPEQIANKVLSTWINNGMFTDAGGLLTMQLTFNNGQFLINGKSPNFEMEKVNPALIVEPTPKQKTTIPEQYKSTEPLKQQPINTNKANNNG